MDNIDSPYNYITSLYNNFKTQRTPKQEKIRNDYLHELREQIKAYNKEKNELLLKCNKIESTNLLIQKKINYCEDKLRFKNIRHSSAANFISLNVNSLRKNLQNEIIRYNKNYSELELLYKKIKNIDFHIYDIEMTIKYHYY